MDQIDVIDAARGAGCDPDLLRNARWSRQAIFEAVAAAFASGDAPIARRGANSSVWSTRKVFIGQRSTIDLGRGIFEIEWRSPVLRLSLALRLGEVRIGVIIPHYSAIISPVHLSDDESYPSGGRGCERVVRDLGKRYILFDYIFSGVRLGDDGLTRSALSGDVRAMEIMADALYHEAHHLREGVVHRVHESGVLLEQVQSAGVQVAESSDMPVEFETFWSQQELCEKTGLSTDAVISVGNSRSGLERFVLLVPEGRKDEVLCALASTQMEAKAA